MAMTAEQRERLQAQVDAFKKRLEIDSNDLDYETHLHTIRTLQMILDKEIRRSND